MRWCVLNGMKKLDRESAFKVLRPICKGDSIQAVTTSTGLFPESRDDDPRRELWRRVCTRLCTLGEVSNLGIELSY